MKTAISIPDDVFHQAEYLARKKGLSRSQFYVQALNAHIEKLSNAQRSITDQLNRVYDRDPSYDQAPEMAALADLARGEP